MKRISFITLFITTNLFFMFFLIYKNSHIVGLTYTKQKYENEYNILLKRRDTLKQKLCMAQNHAIIKDYAANTLKMQKINLKNIKMLPTSS